MQGGGFARDYGDTRFTAGRRRWDIATFWKVGAVLADGGYMSIDQNRAVVHVEAPQERRSPGWVEEI